MDSITNIKEVSTKAIVRRGASHADMIVGNKYLVSINYGLALLEFIGYSVGKYCFSYRGEYVFFNHLEGVYLI